MTQSLLLLLKKAGSILFLLMLPAGLSHATLVTNIAAGGDNSLFLKSDGSLWTTGRNDVGQLGDGTLSSTNQMEQMVSNGVIAIAIGSGDTLDSHILFLKSDGSLWAVGANDYGQLGDGSTNNASVAKEIIPTGVTAIAAGGWHSFFVKSDGSLWAMGRNDYGQLGDGTTNNSSLPEEILPGGVTAVAGGNYHSLLLKTDGSLWAMGRNNHGQLGKGNPPLAANAAIDALIVSPCLLNRFFPSQQPILAANIVSGNVPTVPSDLPIWRDFRFAHGNQPRSTRKRMDARLFGSDWL